MEKNSQLQIAYKFCFLLKDEAIKYELDNCLIGYSLDNIKLQKGGFECEFSDKNNSTISLSISPREIHLYRYKENALSSIVIRDSQILRQVDIERRPNGIIYREIEKQFYPSKRFNNKVVLVDLIEDTYVFAEDNINRIIDKEDFRDIRLKYILLKIKKASMERPLKDMSDLHTKFSTHMNCWVRYERGNKTKHCIYPPRTDLNGEEVSSVFNINDGSDKLYRVYDLYRGIINPRNEEDINLINLGVLSPDAFDFRSFRRITDMENKLVGDSSLEVSVDYINYLSKLFSDRFGYEGEIQVNREGLLNAQTPMEAYNLLTK